MNFEFFDVGAKASTLRPASLVQLATHVVTDWIPGVPPGVATGFANVLGTLLVPDTNASMWCTDRRVAGFDRQWRIATSWILGVAVCREILSGFGYPFWAPVSAFASKSGAPSANYWAPLLPRSHCTIAKPSPPTSKLLPDYVAARLISKKGMAIAFAESKGCTFQLSHRRTAPKSWRNQVRNADFSFNGGPVQPERRVIVATRINPTAKREKTRRLVVRAWNAEDDPTLVGPAATLELVAIHYFGICQMLGLEGTAKMISLAARRPPQRNSPAAAQWEREVVAAGRALAAERPSLRDRWSFPVGRRTLRLGFDQFGQKIVERLASPDADRTMEVRAVLDQMAAEERDPPSEAAFTRVDGVTATLG